MSVIGNSIPDETKLNDFSMTEELRVNKISHPKYVSEIFARVIKH